MQVRLRCQREVDSAFPWPHSQPSAATLDRLPYLEAVVLETLRLRPPAYIVGRCASRDLQLALAQSDSGPARLEVPAGVTWRCNIVLWRLSSKG